MSDANKVTVKLVSAGGEIGNAELSATLQKPMTLKQILKDLGIQAKKKSFYLDGKKIALSDTVPPGASLTVKENPRGS